MLRLLPCEKSASIYCSSASIHWEKIINLLLYHILLYEEQREALSEIRWWRSKILNITLQCFLVQSSTLLLCSTLVEKESWDPVLFHIRLLSLVILFSGSFPFSNLKKKILFVVCNLSIFEQLQYMIQYKMTVRSTLDFDCIWWVFHSICSYSHLWNKDYCV